MATPGGPVEAQARDKWNTAHPNLPWEQLTAGQRQGLVLEQLTPEPDSVPSLRAALRKARIDNLILEKKLAAALLTIDRLKASAPLAEALAASEDDEPSCP